MYITRVYHPKKTIHATLESAVRALCLERVDVLIAAMAAGRSCV